MSDTTDPRAELRKKIQEKFYKAAQFRAYDAGYPGITTLTDKTMKLIDTYAARPHTVSGHTPQLSCIADRMNGRVCGVHSYECKSGGSTDTSIHSDVPSSENSTMTGDDTADSLIGGSTDSGDDELQIILLKLGAKFQDRTRAAYQGLDEDPKLDDIIDIAKTAIRARERRIVAEALDLLYWKYKELNGQSVDKAFVEAYNVLTSEVRQSLPGAEPE